LLPIEYTPEETATWTSVYTQLQQLYPHCACRQYLHNLRALELAGLYSPARIPQLSDVDEFMQSRSVIQNSTQSLFNNIDKTGFRLRPCGGLLSARDFLASLALRTFQVTTYLRHHAQPQHSPEP
jgi:phenylalanine-4-hydroxylase